MKKNLFIWFFLLIFLVGTVSASLTGLVFTLGQNYGLNFVAQGSPELVKAINFAISPESALTSELKTAISAVSPNAADLVKVWGTVENPKQMLLGEAMGQLAKTDPKAAKLVQNGLELSSYAKVAFQSQSGSKEDLAVITTDEKGNTIVKKNGKEFAFIPNGYSVKETEGKLIFTNDEAEGVLKVGDYQISNVKKGSKVTYYEEKDKINIEVEEGSVVVGGVVIKDIKSAKIRIDKNKQVEFAEFISTKSEKYTFNYNKKIYNFETQENSHIIFDPLNKKVSGENINLKLENKEITGSLSADLDDKGDFRKISFKAGGKFIDKENVVSATSGKDFDVCFGLGLTCSKQTNVFSFEKKEQGLVLSTKGEISYKLRETEFNCNAATTKLVSASKVQLDAMIVSNGKVEFNKNGIKGTITNSNGKTNLLYDIKNSKLASENDDRILVIEGNKEYAVYKDVLTVRNENGKIDTSKFEDGELVSLSDVISQSIVIKKPSQDEVRIGLIKQQVALNNKKVESLNPHVGELFTISGLKGYIDNSKQKDIDEMNQLNAENVELNILADKLKQGMTYEEALNSVKQDRIKQSSNTLSLLKSVDENGDLPITACNNLNKNEFNYYLTIDNCRSSLLNREIKTKSGQSLGSFTILSDGEESLTSKIDTTTLSKSFTRKEIKDYPENIKKQLEKVAPQMYNKPYIENFVEIQPRAITSSEDLKDLVKTLELRGGGGFYITNNNKILTLKDKPLIEQEIKRLENLEKGTNRFNDFSSFYKSTANSKEIKGTTEEILKIFDDPLLYVPFGGKILKSGGKTLIEGINLAKNFRKELGVVKDFTLRIAGEEAGFIEVTSGTVAKTRQFIGEELGSGVKLASDSAFLGEVSTGLPRINLFSETANLGKQKTQILYRGDSLTQEQLNNLPFVGVKSKGLNSLGEKVFDEKFCCLNNPQLKYYSEVHITPSKGENAVSPFISTSRSESVARDFGIGLDPFGKKIPVLIEVKVPTDKVYISKSSSLREQELLVGKDIKPDQIVRIKRIDPDTGEVAAIIWERPVQ